MSEDKKAKEYDKLRKQLKTLANRYAVEILQALNPASGNLITARSWDEIVDGMLAARGLYPGKQARHGEKTQARASYEKARSSLVSGGTIYETMSKIIKAGFVTALGSKGKKNRRFMITREGRVALHSLMEIRGPIMDDTEVTRAAAILLKHKNFLSLLPAQEMFLRNVGAVDGNLIIQMPPGSGKTFLAMIAILIRLQRGVRCLYMTPYTSLNRQILDEYGELFENLGYTVVRNDGVCRATESELKSADLTVGTFEAFFGYALQGKKWFKEIGLTVIDELTEIDSNIENVQATTLGIDRSITLDFLITMLKDNSQIITLSSRFGHTERVEEWLGATVFRPNVRLMPDEFIAVQHEKEVDVYSSDGAQGETYKDIRALEAVFRHIGNYQEKGILVVSGSRIGCEIVAGYLSRHFARKVPDTLVGHVLGAEKNLPGSKRLSECLSKGVAFHHSGLDSTVRERLEKSIADGTIKTVVSTTGITQGMSFPFDCVVIIFDSGMYFMATRSRYLQVAGRIGEYYLSQHGGKVYLLYDSPRRIFPTPGDMIDDLLHSPLKPICSGEIHPALMADIVTGEMMKSKTFTKEKIGKSLLKLVGQTLRARVDDGYDDYAKAMFESLFDKLESHGLFSQNGSKYRLSQDAAFAVSSDISVIEYIRVRDQLQTLDDDFNDGDVLDILLKFRLPMSTRPRGYVPSDLELDLAGLEPPDEWYTSVSSQRNELKRQVLVEWISEKTKKDILTKADELTENIKFGERSASVGSEMDSGDFGNLILYCGNIASDLAEFFRYAEKKTISKRLDNFSRRLQFGVMEDLADSDLLLLQVPTEDGLSTRKLTKKEIRTLFERGYQTISDVVRKDIDPQKEGLARERFAENCGLDDGLGMEIYKSGLAYLRAQLDHET